MDVSKKRVARMSRMATVTAAVVLGIMGMTSTQGISKEPWEIEMRLPSLPIKVAADTGSMEVADDVIVTQMKPIETASLTPAPDAEISEPELMNPVGPIFPSQQETTVKNNVYSSESTSSISVAVKKPVQQEKAKAEPEQESVPMISIPETPAVPVAAPVEAAPVETVPIEAAPVLPEALDTMPHPEVVEEPATVSAVTLMPGEATTSGSPAVTVPSIPATPVVRLKEAGILPSYAMENEAESSEEIADADTADVAEPKEFDYEALLASIDSMKEEIDGLKADVKKKQDKADSKNKFVNKVGGLMILNSQMISQSADNRAFYGNANNQTYFQDLRLSLKGSGYNGLSYETTFSFNDNIQYKNLLLSVPRVLFLDDMRIGYFKVESGLNLMESANERTFLAKDTNTTAFQANRRIGMGGTKFFADERVRVYGGVYTGKNFDTVNTSKEPRAYINDDDAGILLNARITGVPIWNEDCEGNLCEVLHVGMSYYWCQLDSSYNLRATSNSWNGGPYMLQGKVPLNDDSYSVTGGEIAWQRGPWGIQSELHAGDYEGCGNAYGASVMGRVFLNPGSYHEYSKSKGCFVGPHIPHNFISVDENGWRCFDGWGAWELATMWSYTDMDDLQWLTNGTAASPVFYGKYNEVVTGLNWWWNPQTRFSLDWTHGMCDSTKKIGDESGTKLSSTTDTIGLQMRVAF